MDTDREGTQHLPGRLRFTTLQRAVIPDSELEASLRRAGYDVDSFLGRYTGWIVEPIETSPVALPSGFFKGRGRNSLFELDPQNVSIVAKKSGTRGAHGPVRRERAREPDRTSPLPSEPASVSSAARTEAPSSWPAGAGARAVGLDWSGSRAAGRKIWQAHLNVTQHRKIVLAVLNQPFVAQVAPASVRSAFAGWFASLRADVVGIDFCFGLHRAHAKRVCAAAGVSASPSVDPMQLGSIVARHFPTPDALRSACAPERKRETDLVGRAPFAPTNLRMFRQTWLGLVCLATLPPLSIAPWACKSEPVVVEVLPASVARARGSDGGYKGRSPEARAGRVALVAAIEALVAVRSAEREQLVADGEGDAIDALLAALAVLRAHQQGFVPPTRPVLDEGWIY